MMFILRLLMHIHNLPYKKNVYSCQQQTRALIFLPLTQRKVISFLYSIFPDHKGLKKYLIVSICISWIK